MSFFHILSVWSLAVTQGYTQSVWMSGVATDLESLSSSALGHLWARSRCSSSWSLGGFASEITEYHGARTVVLYEAQSVLRAKVTMWHWWKGKLFRALTDRSVQVVDTWSVPASSYLLPCRLCFKNLPLLIFFLGKSHRCLPMEAFASAVLQWTEVASVRPEWGSFASERHGISELLWLEHFLVFISAFYFLIPPSSCRSVSWLTQLFAQLVGCFESHTEIHT